MDAVVVFSLVLAVALVAMVGVTVRYVWQTVQRLTAQIRTTTDRLVPLSDELQSELAVTSVEMQGLTASVGRLRREREAASARTKRSRSKRKR